MEFGGAGGFVCPYCGSKAFWTDADFKGNEEFRKKLLQFYKAQAENKENDYSADRFWRVNGTDCFETAEGESLQIEYIKKYSRSGFVCYIAHKSVVYVLNSESAYREFMSGLQRVKFPPADNKLHRCFPEIKAELK